MLLADLPMNTIDADNLWITITIVLFALSLISERLGNFVKLNLQSIPWIDNKLGNFRYHEKDPKCEKLRERGILWLSIISGVTVAVAMKADLFFLLAQGKLATDALAGETSFIGYLATGLFLSLGSKFWHDLLDLLLYTANIKKKLVDPETYDITSANELKETLELSEEEIARRARTQNLDSLKREFPNSDIGVELLRRAGKKVKGIVIQVYDKGNVDLSRNRVFYTSPSGKNYPVPVEILQTDKVVPHLSLEAGHGIKNATRSGTGTFGCLVTDLHSGEKLILSCYHVVKSKAHHWNSFQALGQETILDTSSRNQLIGKLVRGFRDQYVDFGLVKPEVSIEVLDQKTDQQLTIPNGYRQVTETDADLETPVFFKGKTAGSLKRGIILNHSTEVTIDYSSPDSSPNSNRTSGDWTFFNLIKISQRINNQWKALSQGGDSGAIVYDQNNVAIGMIVGGNSHFSYALPIHYLFKNTGIVPYSKLS